MKQLEIVEALQSHDESFTRAGLKAALTGVDFDDFETERSFILACYFVVEQKVWSIQRDWNHSVFYLDPFNSQNELSKIDVPFFTANESDKTKRAMIDILEKAQYDIKPYCFAKLKLSPWSTHMQLESFEIYSIGNLLDSIKPDSIRPNFLRFEFTTIKKIQPKKREPRDPNFNPFGDGASDGGSDGYREPVPAREPPPPITDDPISAVKTEIVDFPEVEAEFPGGNHLLKEWIKSNLVYPELSRELGDQGRVYVLFTLETDGTASDVEVYQGGVSDELNHEAKRLIRIMPKWNPAQENGQPVRSRHRVPVTFTLE